MTESEYIIQNAAREHLPDLAAIEVAAAATFPPGYLPAGTEVETTPLSAFQEAWENGRLWVSLNRGRPVGFALVILDDGLNVLDEVDVLPAYQGRGQGAGEGTDSAGH